MCGGVEKAEVVEMGVEVVEAMYQTMNRNSASTRSSYTWWSSFGPWIAFAASTAPYPSHATHTTPCISCQPP